MCRQPPALPGISRAHFADTKLSMGACGLWVGPGVPEAENESQAERAGQNTTDQAWGDISACGQGRALTGSPGPLLPCSPGPRDAVLTPQKRVHTLWGEGLVGVRYPMHSTYVYWGPTVCQAPCYTLKTLRGFDRPCLAPCSRQMGSAKGSGWKGHLHPAESRRASQRRRHLNADLEVEGRAWLRRGGERRLRQTARSGCADEQDEGLSPDAQPSCLP